LNTFSYSVIALKPDQFSVISPAMARPVATSKWLESWQSKAILTAFGVVTMTLLSALGWSISGHVDIIRSDVSELKGDIKELRTDTKEIRASLAEVAKATALTAQRLDQTNEKLQGLIDETRKRR
jgi:outer membrane murein-binding lipoprotein Lpp